MANRCAPNASIERNLSVLLLVAFFASGAAGLIHEVVWARLFRLTIGHTAIAMTVVLTATMGGLAVGSLVAGRAISRRGSPLIVFGVIEFAIGGYALLLPSLIDALEPILQALYRTTSDSAVGYALGRFALSASLVCVPAALMGASLPVVAHRIAHRRDRFGAAVGRVYGINTLGAAVGAGAAGFALLPNLGTQHTLVIGSTINFAACALAFGCHWFRPNVQSTEKPNAIERPGPQTRSPRLVSAVVVVSYGLSGAFALVLETAWTRVLALMIGSSVYAFSTILIAFILGLAIGSAACATRADRIRHPIRALAAVTTGIGLSALAVVPLIAELPVPLTIWLARLGGEFWPTQLAQLGLSLAVMLVPTVLMGAAMPLVTRVLAVGTGSAARSLGNAYGINAFGGAVGAFVAAWLLIPTFGLRATIVTAAVGMAALGALQWSVSGRGGATRGAAALALVGLVAAVMPGWDPSWLGFGPFAQARRLSLERSLSAAALEQIQQSSEILYQKSGREGLVTVREFDSGDRVLYVGGKPDASTRDDLATQILLAHVPLLLHPAPRSALVIGLASGMTVGSAGLHPLEILDVAEISAEVVEASHFFDAHNGRILEDPRVRLIVADGRDLLARTDRSYDVIISEPSNPWIEGVADLFTLEFFELCRDRLNDGGIATVWLESYVVDPDAFASVVRSFASVFDRPTLWNSELGDYLLVGSRGGAPIDLGEFTRRLADERIATDLARAGVRGATELLSHLLADSAGIARFAGNARMHTDDNALLEFATPRLYRASPSEDRVIAALDAQPPRRLEFLRSKSADRAELAALSDRVSRVRRAKRQVRRAIIARESGKNIEALDALRKAAGLAPNDRGLATEYRLYRTSALGMAKQRRFDEAIALYRRAQIHPISAGRARRELALLLDNDGELEVILDLYTAAQREQPDEPAITLNLGIVAHRLGQETAALDHYEWVLERDPHSFTALNNLSRILSTPGDPALRDTARALQLAKRACAVSKNQDPHALDTLRIAYAAAGMVDEARDAARRARALSAPSLPEGVTSASPRPAESASRGRTRPE